MEASSSPTVSGRLLGPTVGLSPIIRRHRLEADEARFGENLFAANEKTPNLQTGSLVDPAGPGLSPTVRRRPACRAVGRWDGGSRVCLHRGCPPCPRT